MSTTSTASAEVLVNEYLRRVTALYGAVEEWISKLKPEPSISSEEIVIHEESVGEYKAQNMVIKREGYKDVRLIPRGRWIIGAEGRIDMESALGIETFVYIRDGGPHLSIEAITEGGRILEKNTRGLCKGDLTQGWVYVQNRRLGMLVTLNEYLFHRLLEVLSE